MRNPKNVDERTFYYVVGAIKALAQKIQRTCQPLGDTSIHSARVKKLVGKTSILHCDGVASQNRAAVEFVANVYVWRNPCTVGSRDEILNDGDTSTQKVFVEPDVHPVNHAEY